MNRKKILIIFIVLFIVCFSVILVLKNSRKDIKQVEKKEVESTERPFVDENSEDKEDDKEWEVVDTEISKTETPLESTEPKNIETNQNNEECTFNTKFDEVIYNILGLDDIKYDLKYYRESNPYPEKFEVNIRIIFDENDESKFVKCINDKGYGYPGTLMRIHDDYEDAIRKLSGQKDIIDDNVYDMLMSRNRDKLTEEDNNMITLKDAAVVFSYLYYWRDNGRINVAIRYQEDGCINTDYDEKEYIFE